MNIGLVTVLFRSESCLPDFLRCLAALEGVEPYTVFVDNSSPDASADIVARTLGGESSARHALVRVGANLGAAEGDNIGIRKALAAGCRKVLLLNNDVEFPPAAVAALVRAGQDEGAHLVTPLITVHGTDRIWMAGGRITLTGAGLHFGEGQHLSARPTARRFVPYAPTCFMLVDAEVFRQIGLMDPAYFVYGNDCDFVHRAARAGFRVLLEPAVAISHKVSTSTGGTLSPFTLRYANRNRVYFIRKHLQPPKRQLALAWFVATRLKYGLTLRREQAVSVGKAVREGLRMTVGDGGRPA